MKRILPIILIVLGIVEIVIALMDIKMPIITTEKDAVKIKDFDLDNIYALKLRLNLNCRELLDD